MYIIFFFSKFKESEKEVLRALYFQERHDTRPNMSYIYSSFVFLLCILKLQKSKLRVTCHETIMLYTR